MNRPILVDINPVVLNYYPFFITLDKCNGNCNVVDELSTKMCVSEQIKRLKC